ncbi:MAG: tRNA pseudouridine(55) synthase TruB [Pseudomonadales bacterium]|jgi:tRNA pseudouridine55 synthase|nr:tRNA pseudouridine(55) synthase TruB [Pseudomonadales bacterium]
MSARPLPNPPPRAGEGVKSRRPIDGILSVDKPLGQSSNHCLQLVKRWLQAEKAGHTGALDPLATGVLPLCFGEATKLSQILLDADKAYLATLRLGIETATCDADGEILRESAVPLLDEAMIEAALARFRGPQRQVAPVYSALKQDGVPQYKLARAGKPVQAKERDIVIHALSLVEWRAQELVLRVRCSKGTYIRSLARDIGVALNSGAHLSALRREQAGPFTLARSHGLDELRQCWENGGPAAIEALLLPVDFAVQDWPALWLNEANGLRFWQGQTLRTDPGQAPGPRRIYGGERFLGIAELLPDASLRPLRLVKYAPIN